LGFNPSAEDALHPLIEILQPYRAHDLKGIGPPEIHGIVHGEEERNEVDDMVGVKMGNEVEIDLPEVQAQAGHRAQAAPSAVEENQVGPEGESQTRRTSVHRGDAGT
jgi:hypothetical protein